MKLLFFNPTDGYIEETNVSTSGASFVLVESEDQKLTVGTNETLLAEESVDFDLLSSTDITCQLTALTKQSVGDGTYRIRVGGTLGAADGIEAVALTTTQVNYPIAPDRVIGSSFTRPTGTQLVKITGVGTNIGAEVRLRAFQIVFTAV